MKKEQNAFTLVELLAVIVILAIVLIIAVPGVLSIINKTKDNALDRQLDMIKEAAKHYMMVESDHVKWIDHTTTYLSLDLLKHGGYLDKKVLNPQTKQEITCMNTKVTKTGKNYQYEVMECPTSSSFTESLPNAPRLGSGMIPIVYKDGNWVKANSTNQNNTWYNYDAQEWANVAIVTEDVRQALLEAPEGTVVPMDQIKMMLVWIPRFEYRLFNVDGTVSPVGNENMDGDYLVSLRFSQVYEPKVDGRRNSEWLTHPAFTLENQELEGFWVGKFEMGFDGATNGTEAEQDIVDSTKIITKPNVYSWRSVVYSRIYKNIMGLKNTGTLFGITSTEDPHMIKNMEWGAMTYLTQSRYGKAGNSNYVGVEKQVRINNNKQYITGCGADAQDAVGGNDCYSYDTANGQTASTTGNISGVYDTSGGSWEATGSVLLLNNQNDGIPSYSEFQTDELASIIKENKYLTIYSYSNDKAEYSRGHLGDATLEMGPFYELYNAWYGDVAQMIWNESRWFVRGNTSYNDPQRNGITSFGSWYGGVSVYVTSRVVFI